MPPLKLINKSDFLLRYLQTLSTIAAERNSTIVFPLPIELVGGLMNKPSK